mmetsp:Transcript_95745/g.219477  ORF Transcript_95745/g.219477 Transcript_95745/m.219477 type:complete len:411 (+) Transcript_95745:80-1312(+)
MMLLCGLLAVPFASGAVVIDAMKHDIQQIQAGSFDTIIGKFRDDAVSAVWYYKESNGGDEKFLDEYQKVAKELKGIVKVCAMDCERFGKFCKDAGVVETPTVMIYPPNPQPSFPLQGELTSKRITNVLTKSVPSFVTTLTADNEAAFLTSDPSKPKVILFSNKPKAPFMWRALSAEMVFKRTIKFAFATEEANAELAKKFKVKKFPSIVMQRGGKAEQKETYSGDINFQAIYAWVNLYSESGMGDKVKSAGGSESSSEEAKPWLIQDIPELTGPSHNDVCFKSEGLCVIYLKKGGITEAETTMLTGLKNRFTSHLDGRGTVLKWMWMDLDAEPNLAEMFEVSTVPGAAVFNPHKRLRFTKLDDEVTADETSMAALVDKIMGGDARFKPVKGQKLPTWSVRAKEEKKKTEL